jgi:hypothetical protein
MYDGLRCPLAAKTCGGHEKQAFFKSILHLYVFIPYIRVSSYCTYL